MAPSRRDFLAYAAAASVVAIRTARGQDFAAPGALAKPDVAGFDQVWELVRDRFYDPRLHGVDWSAMRDRYRAQATSARSSADLAIAINAMLGTLNASHTRYYTRDEPAYYQLADIFAGALEHRGLRRIFPDGEVAYPGIGIFTETDDQGRLFVAGAIQGAPAHEAGLLVGDEILSADDRPFEPVGAFRGKVGGKVALSIRRAAGAVPMTVAVAPAI